MPIYKIRGIDVDFPYEAYDCQIVYMDKVIQSLQDKSNALLESPTGTGKTLCLLCATLAWRRNLGEFSTGGKVRLGSTQSQPDSLSQSQQAAETKLPTIVYTTRTHSQLHQVIQELKRTNYRPKMVVIGSREQLCINNEVQMLHGRAQTNACQFLRRKRKCSHYARISDFVKDNSGLGDDPIDIEDLVNIGRLQGPCPYYLSRELHKVVDILFAPYNYLIDRGNRKSLSIKWQDSVLIFDEAHNLESICADAASFDLPSSLLTACILEAKKCVNLAVEKRAVEKFNDKSVSPDAFAILEALLQKLEKRIAEVPIESRELGFTRPGPYIYELLADLNITQDTTNMLIDTITNGVTLLEDAENASSSGTNKTKGTIHRLEALADMLRIIFNEGDKSHAKSYRVHVQEAETRALDALKGRTSRTLSWWCFNPGIAMEEFSKLCVGSIILTSGTLSPLDSFAHELKLNFPVRLENPHVISSNQIWAGVVPAGPSGCSFNSSYRNRDSLTYKQDLGNAIANFARIVPDGLLVFFPSYYLLDQCIGCWKDMSHSSSENSTTIWERICKHKQPVVEPKQSSLFSSSIDDFMAKLNDISTSGAVFFAVCRGKVSEGLDFADHTGRAVVITGMPFATWNDPKVRLKRDYLDHQTAPENKSFKALTGDEWYSQQASRAVNQAVGRVIRHRDDYGAILFCDERFSSSNNQRQMSRWLQPHIKCFSNFGEVNFTLTRFFREKVTSGLGKSTKPVKSDSKSSTKVSPPPHKLLSAETIAVSGTADKEIPKRSFSSVSAAYKSDVCTNLEEIVPANRSSLTPYKKDYFTALKQSRDVFGTANRLSTPASKRKVLKDQKSPVIDLTGTSERDEQREKAQSNVLCCSKESKLLKLDPEIAVHSKKQPHLEKIHDVKNEHLASYSSSSISQQHGNHLQLSQCSSAKAGIGRSYGNKKNPEVGPVVIFENNVTSKDNVLELPSQKDIPSGTVPCNDESSGYIFLTQVKEMLTVEEYKEFVGYMKAMKTKKMKINQVFQSVATLFSSPERYVLLVSFKDYLPTKYKPVFEQYLRTHDAAADG